MTRPALLLDVDGVLNPYAAPANRRPGDYLTHRYPMPGHRRPLRVWLNPGHGQMLLASTDRFDLTWATTWQHAANDWIGPRIGLPKLPVITFDPVPPTPTTIPHAGPGVHWKTATVARAMAGRFFVWIDDETTDADAAYLAARHTAGAAVYRIDPAVGLLAEDLTAIRAITKPGLYRGPTPSELRRRRRQAGPIPDSATGPTIT
ncbi:HAD domain-containing protein [Nakamurella multipartita]|nr:HAD domain-containing protein [Nakamurella multipartita]